MTSATTTARPPAQDMDDAVDAAIGQAARTLHLPAIRDGYEQAVAHALRERFTYKQFLAGILGEEVADREQRRRLRLVREAAFPRPKRIEDFDYSANPNISAEQVATLCHPAWVTAGQPLCLIGDSGTGKSHLLTGIGTAIAEAGLKVRYATAANLVNELAEAADDRQLTRVLAVASNAPFSEWKRTFTDPRLCSAIVDRLTYNAHIIETGTDSFRLAQASRAHAGH